MRLRAAALVLLTGAAACAGRTVVDVPLADIEFGEPTEPEGYVIEGLRAPPDGMLAVTIGSAPGQEPTPPTGEPAESGVDQSADRRAHTPEDAGSSPAPATAAATRPDPPTSFVEVLASELDANRAFVLDLVLGILDRTAASSPPPENPAPAAAPEPAAFAGPPKPPDPELAAILREDEGETLTPYEDVRGYWHIGIGHRITESEMEAAFLEDMAEAEQAARRVLGDGYDRLGRWRRNAWIVACFWGGCASYDAMKHATLTGDWEAAAREAQTTALASSWASINPERAADLAHWLRTGERDR